MISGKQLKKYDPAVGLPPIRLFPDDTGVLEKTMIFDVSRRSSRETYPIAGSGYINPQAVRSDYLISLKCPRFNSRKASIRPTERL